MRRLALLLGIITPLPAQAPAGPPLVLNHLYLVLDSATFHDIGVSPLLARGFGGFESRTTSSGTERWTATYLYGRHTYLEFFGPGGYSTLRPGDVGIGAGVERPGGILALARRFESLGAAFDTLTRMRDDSSGTIPWFLGWRPGGTDTPSERASFWVMEYTTELARRLALRDSLPVDDRSRARFLPQPSDPSALLADLTGATLAIPVEDIVKIHRALERSGASVVAEGEGAIIRLGGFRLRLIPAWERPGVRRLEFSLVREAVANPTYRFGARSRLRFGPGPLAVWDF